MKQKQNEREGGNSIASAFYSAAEKSTGARVCLVEQLEWKPIPLPIV
jgi:hypothetical protein